MPTIPSLKIRSSPLVEVALTVVTDEPIVDLLGIGNLHKAEFPQYPEIERRAPVAGIDNSEIFNIPPAIRDTDLGAAPRYWLIASDGRDLLQLQERFVSRNWRRQASPLEPVDYPGYDNISASAFEDFAALVRNAGGAGQAPEPVGFQLLYDNVVVMRRRNGEPFKLGDVLANWNTLSGTRPNIGWHLQWGEPLPPEGVMLQVGDTFQPNIPVLNTSMMVGSFIDEGKVETIPVLRITLTVTGQAHSWDQLREFFDAAHGKVREKFISLLTEEIRSEWDAA
ncbi:TIGR04255 family protein [Sphingomonas hankookensis]